MSKIEVVNHPNPTTPESIDMYLERLQFATNEHGQRLMSIDPVYREHVEAELTKYYPGNGKEITPTYVKQNEWWLNGEGM